MHYDENLVCRAVDSEDPAKDQAHDMWREDGVLIVDARVFAEICFQVGPRAAIRALHEFRDPIITYPTHLPED